MNEQDRKEASEAARRLGRIRTERRVSAARANGPVGVLQGQPRL
jgi:hypothetical protein